MKATVGITMGDPAGIGPEIVVKALSNSEVYDVCKPVVVGDLRLLSRAVDQFKLSERLRAIESPLKALGKAGIVEVVDLHNVDFKRFRIGKASKETGKASIEYIEAAVKYALNGELDAIATAPINKESIHLAGSSHMGHTELMGALTSIEEPITMFWIRGLTIFFLTRHLPLRMAIEAVDKDRIVALTVKVEGILRRMGFEKPRIAIAALNPHASDGSLIGNEEEREIIPAIKEVRGKGIKVIGPIAADAVFHRAFSGEYDAVISLYHDQGHIPAKTVDFHGVVSVTLGLPFVRTSVDHGTAFDIAGKGIANSKSLEEAIKVAAELTLRFKK